MHLLPTHRAGGMQFGPELAVLHDAPSAAAGEQVPSNAALHVPLPLQTAYDDGLKIESTPHLGLASVSWKHLPELVLQPTALARSHWVCSVQLSPTFPATGAAQVPVAKQTWPALQEPSTHPSPRFVAAAH